MNFPFMRGMPEQQEYVRFCPSPEQSINRNLEIQNTKAMTNREEK